jgi:hypothetical protein
MKGLYLSSAITNPEDHLMSIDISFVHKYSRPETSCPRSMRTNEWLVFHTLHRLFSTFHELPPECQDLLLKSLHESKLNKWSMTIAALPPLFDTHHLPFLMMLLSGYNMFSKVHYPEPLYFFSVASSTSGRHWF